MIYPFLECARCKYLTRYGPCPAMTDGTMYDARITRCPHLAYNQDYEEYVAPKDSFSDRD